VLRDAENWIWDSWIADDGERYHLFFLKAPRALGDPGLRHTAARIGHATSNDLVDWEVHADALGPNDTGFDSLALWTGSVARGDDGVWRLYYTALNTEGREVRDQRIGFAESPDLFTWRRAALEPIVSPDPRWYRTLDGVVSETWRDPFVFRVDGLWHMLITARDPDAPRLRDGMLAHATSEDMLRWELQPPLTRPSRFGQLEVPQVREVDGRWLLLFTCHPDEQFRPDDPVAGGEFCTWIVEAGSPLGPFDIDAARPFTREPNLFAAPLVQDRAGRWVFLGFRSTERDFHIIDPIPLRT
jgi:beta-fructofuranosidase